MHRARFNCRFTILQYGPIQGSQVGVSVKWNEGKEARKRTKSTETQIILAQESYAKFDSQYIMAFDDAICYVRFSVRCHRKGKDAKKLGHAIMPIIPPENRTHHLKIGDGILQVEIVFDEVTNLPTRPRAISAGSLFNGRSRTESLASEEHSDSEVQKRSDSTGDYKRSKSVYDLESAQGLEPTSTLSSPRSNVEQSLATPLPTKGSDEPRGRQGSISFSAAEAILSARRALKLGSPENSKSPGKQNQSPVSDKNEGDELEVEETSLYSLLRNFLQNPSLSTLQAVIEYPNCSGILHQMLNVEIVDTVEKLLQQGVQLGNETVCEVCLQFLHLAMEGTKPNIMQMIAGNSRIVRTVVMTFKNGVYSGTLKALDILTLMCHSGQEIGGHQNVLEAFSYYRKIMRGKRFECLLELLRQDDVGILIQTMRVINSMLTKEPLIQNRVTLREEFERLEIWQLAENIRGLDSDLEEELDEYLFEDESDRENLKEKAEDKPGQSSPEASSPKPASDRHSEDIKILMEDLSESIASHRDADTYISLLRSVMGVSHQLPTGSTQFMVHLQNYMQKSISMITSDSDIREVMGSSISMREHDSIIEEERKASNRMTQRLQYRIEELEKELAAKLSIEQTHQMKLMALTKKFATKLEAFQQERKSFYQTAEDCAIVLRNISTALPLRLYESIFDENEAPKFAIELETFSARFEKEWSACQGHILEQWISTYATSSNEQTVPSDAADANISCTTPTMKSVMMKSPSLQHAALLNSRSKSTSQLPVDYQLMSPLSIHSPLPNRFKSENLQIDQTLAGELSQRDSNTKLQSDVTGHQTDDESKRRSMPSDDTSHLIESAHIAQGHGKKDEVEETFSSVDSHSEKHTSEMPSKRSSVSISTISSEQLVRLQSSNQLPTQAGTRGSIDLRGGSSSTTPKMIGQNGDLDADAMDSLQLTDEEVRSSMTGMIQISLETKELLSLVNLDSSASKDDPSQGSDSTSIPPPPPLSSAPNIGSEYGDDGSAPPPPPPPPPFAFAGGPPPPPPPGIPGAPPPPGFRPSASLPPKPTIRPSVPMKQLFWTKVPANKVTRTIWKDCSDEVILKEIDTEELETLFLSKPAATISGSERERSRSVGAKSYLDKQRAQNISIMLSTTKMPASAIKQAIIQVDEKLVPSDLLRKLISSLPRQEEIDVLKDHRDEYASLDKADQFMLDLMSIPRIESRLKAWETTRKFDVLLEDIEAALGFIVHSCEQLQSSQKFKQILETVLAFGNYLNGGSFRGGAYGFKLECLSKLKDTKATNAKTNLLSYLVDFIDKKHPELMTVNKDFSSLSDAVKYKYEGLKSDLSELEKSVETVDREAKYKPEEDSESQSSSDQFNYIFGIFVRSSREKLQSMRKRFDEFDKAYATLLELYGEEPGSIPPDEFFSSVNGFLTAFQETKLRIDKDKLTKLHREKKLELMRLKREQAATSSQARRHSVNSGESSTNAHTNLEARRSKEHAPHMQYGAKISSPSQRLSSGTKQVSRVQPINRRISGGNGNDGDSVLGYLRESKLNAKEK